jgi:hypothetical protein
VTQVLDRDRFNAVVQLLADHPELDVERLRALVDAPAGGGGGLSRFGPAPGRRSTLRWRRAGSRKTRRGSWPAYRSDRGRRASGEEGRAMADRIVGVRLVADRESVDELATALRTLFTVLVESEDREDEMDPRMVTRYLGIVLQDPPGELALSEPRYRLQVARRKVRPGTPVALLDADDWWWPPVATTGVEAGRRWAVVWVRRVGEDRELPWPAGDLVALPEVGGDG